MSDLKKAVEIADGVYWVGIRRNIMLEINVYLRIYKSNGKQVNVLIDPGPPSDFDTIAEKVKPIIGDIRNVHIAFVNHQDPDVGTNAMYIQKFNPNLTVITSEDTWRLIRFYGLNPKRFQATDKFPSQKAQLSTGDIIQFVPTPFCHFRGAVMYYDPKSRILFSGDFLGGLSFSEELYATSDNWSGVRTFHQIYMASQNALRLAVDQIRKLNPQPLMIAPQHGGIIKGDLMDEFLRKMYDLPVGLDLFQDQSVDKELYIEAINDILSALETKISPTFVSAALAQFQSDGSFPNIFIISGNRIQDVKADVLSSYQALLNTLMNDQPEPIIETIKNAVLKASIDWNMSALSEGLFQRDAAPSEFLTAAGR